jgi:hypothetical protein
LKVLDPELRKLAESGELNGVSMFGNAEVEVLHKTTNTNMTPEQMQAFCEMLTKSLAAAIKPQPVNTPAPAPAQPIAFEGDPLNPEDLAKHMDRVLFASLDLSKPADLAKWQGHVAKRQAEKKVQPGDELAKAQADLKAAQEKLAKIQKSSGAPEGTEGDDAQTSSLLSKSEQAQFEAGKKAMQSYQKKNRK